MYVIEHALLNLGKNKGRNIILGVMIFAIITATVVALSIYNTTGIIIDDTRAAFMSAVRVAPQKQIVSGQEEAAVSIDQYMYFAESEYLSGSDIRESGRGMDGVDAIYYLKHPDMLAAFEKEIRDKGLPDDYVVRTDESAFEGAVGSVESLNRLALTFIIIVLALGAAIMVLLSAISVRERKYEIGVLRAMGMKKNKIALGLWTEIIVITCICFALGLGAGAALAQPVAGAIMSGQAETASVSQSSTLADRLNVETNDPGPAVEVDVAVNGITALEIFIIAILLASIAGIVSVSRITKYEPIKILMERN